MKELEGGACIRGQQARGRGRQDLEDGTGRGVKLGSLKYSLSRPCTVQGLLMSC